MARSSTTMHKPKSRSKGVYDGEPSHLRWVGANLVIAKSDGSSNARYHDVGLGDVKEEADGKKSVYRVAEDETRHLWLAKVANYLVYESRMQLAKDRKIYILSDFPAGYKLYTHYSKRPIDEEWRTDSYLHGSTTKGCARFRSPEEFALHAKWLAYGSPAGQCECRWCSRTKQGEITKRLKQATSFITDWTPSESAHRSQMHRRRAPVGSSTSMAPAKSVVAKDYINGGIWVSKNNDDLK